jgi:hypothetical protein
MAAVFDDKFLIVSSDGSIELKSEYISRLGSGDFIHNDIEIEDNSAIVEGNTAVVSGKGKFTVTIKGNKVSLRLSYIEVFSRKDPRDSWKVLARKASILDK